jgi:hypothetical protein
MPAAPAYPRTPLVIAAGNLVVGPVRATYRTGDRESLLHSYLVLVRKMRGQQREPSITLRAADISALAEHLGVDDERVLDDLLERMGATRAQRTALLAAFAVGALTIVATGSIALDLAPAGVFAQGAEETTGVVGAVEFTSTVVDPVTDTAVDVTAAESTPDAAEAADASPEPELPLAVGGTDWEYSLALQQLSAALAAQQTTDTAGVGVADDGSVVAVGQAPVPSGEGVGVADDGSVVAVGQAPVPSGEGIGVADDGSIVGVAPPPVP